MPTDTEIAEAYSWAMEHAAIQTRNRGSDLAEIAGDAATDGVMWALGRYIPAKGEFGPFSAAAVRRCVRRAILAHVQRDKPAVFSLDTKGDREGDWLARDDKAAPLTIDDLPEDLAFAVRLYMVDGYDLRECGMLLGCDKNAVQRKLRKAAELLAPGRIVPDRKTGSRRLGRTKPDRDSH